MKTIEELLSQTPIFNGFSDAQDVFSEFNEAPENVLDVNILYASYETPPYEGYAFVLFEENGKLYEVNASHCSCYGLEDQWEPEEVVLKELEHRLTKGNIDAVPDVEVLLKFLGFE